MPKNVRNFWLECEVDGRRETVACGPRAKDGGLRLKLKVRNRGEVHEVLLLTAYVERCNPEKLRVEGDFLSSKGKSDPFDYAFPR